MANETKVYNKTTDETTFSNIDVDKTGNECNVIPTNKYARAMRMRMEDKSLLVNKGAIYVGTGKTQTVTPTQGGAPEVIPITAPLNPPTEEGIYVLQWTFSGGKGELAWVKKESNSDSGSGGAIPF